MSSKGDVPIQRLLSWFIREEWRMFTSLFGTVRFALFPLAILAFAFILGVSAPLIDADPVLLAVAFHVLIVLFGLQTGVSGFDARDALDDVLGDTSRILFTSRTLPISQRRLVTVFLVKDAIFYSLLFLLPIVFGGLVGLALSPFETEALYASISVIPVLTLYATTLTSFVLGVSFGFVATTVNLQQLESILILGMIGGVTTGILNVTETSLRELGEVSPLVWLITSTIMSFMLFALGLWQFKETKQMTRERHENWYKQLVETLNISRNPWYICMKNLVDIRRSAGGFWKVVFSTVVIVLASIVFIYMIGRFFGLNPRPEFIFGGLFSLIAYPLYTIVFRYDSVESYSAYPISEADVYKAKVLLFGIIGFPLAISYYTPVVLPGVTIEEYLLGLVVLVSLMVYQLGLLIVFVEDQPMEFLFDGMLFSSYSLALFVYLVPLMVIGMYGGGSLITPGTVNIVLLATVAAGIVGGVLTTVYATDKWGNKEGHLSLGE